MLDYVTLVNVLHVILECVSYLNSPLRLYFYYHGALSAYLALTLTRARAQGDDAKRTDRTLPLFLLSHAELQV